MDIGELIRVGWKLLRELAIPNKEQISNTHEKDLEKSLGLNSSFDFEDQTYVAFVSTPYGINIPLIFDKFQWKLIHELAEMSKVDPAEIIVDVARSRYFGENT